MLKHNHDAINNLKIQNRGFENSSFLKMGDVIVAEIFSAKEPADQHATAQLFATSPDLLKALETSLHYTELCLEYGKASYATAVQSGMMGAAAEIEKQNNRCEKAIQANKDAIEKATKREY